MTFNEAIDKAAKALDAAEDSAHPEDAREFISAASTWLRMAEILNYVAREAKTAQQ